MFAHIGGPAGRARLLQTSAHHELQLTTLLKLNNTSESNVTT